MRHLLTEAHNTEINIFFKRCLTHIYQILFFVINSNPFSVNFIGDIKSPEMGSIKASSLSKVISISDAFEKLGNDMNKKITLKK